MIPYILHVSILIAAGVLFYKLALKRLTFYVLNRWVLLSCLVAAFLLPLVPMPGMLSWRAMEMVKPETASKQETVAVVETSSKGETVVRPADAEKTNVKPETPPKREAVAITENP